MKRKYTCSDCSKKFNYKSDYLRHRNRKKPCGNKKKERRNVCKYCDKIFSSSSCANRHMKNSCPKKKLCEEAVRKEIHDENKEMREAMELMEKKIIMLSKQVNANTQINNNNCHNTNIGLQNNIDNSIDNSINITINNVGEENMDYVTQKMKKKVLKSMHRCYQELIQLLHFDENHPENHNFYISNKRASTGHMKENGKWVTKNIDELVMTVLEKKRDQIDQLIIELEEEIPNKMIKRVEEASDAIDYTTPKGQEVDEGMYNLKKRIHTDIRNGAYDNCDIIRKSRDMYDRRKRII